MRIVSLLPVGRGAGDGGRGASTPPPSRRTGRTVRTVRTGQNAVQVNATLSPAFSLNWQPPTGVDVPLTEMFQ